MQTLKNRWSNNPWAVALAILSLIVIVPHSEQLLGAVSGQRHFAAKVLVDKNPLGLEWSTELATTLAREDADEPVPDDRITLTKIASYGRGELRQKDHLPVLILRGSYFEMGEQYGHLAGDQVVSMLRLFDDLAERESSGLLPRAVQVRMRRWLGDLFEPHFPESARAMMEGMVSGAAQAGITLHPSDINFLNSLIDIAGIGSTNLSFSSDGWGAASALVALVRREVGTSWIAQNCNTFAAWGRRTEEGKTFQTRNTDIAVGLGLEQHPLVYIAFPEQDGPQDPQVLLPYTAAGFAGQVGASTGLNAAGVGLGQVWAFSRTKSIGIPWSLLMIDVLSKARSAPEATKLLVAQRTSPHTYGNNFTFADAQGNGLAVELNPLTHAIFRDGDVGEVAEGRMSDGRVWAVPLPDAVVRADFSMSRKIRSDQTSAKGPHGYPPEASSYRLRYAGQIKRILGFEKMERRIGAREAMVISRATADRKSGNMQLAVYANTDRRMWVSYATNRNGSIRQAFENPFVLIPFDAVLNEMAPEVGMFHY
jgi:hypothetical protein